MKFTEISDIHLEFGKYNEEFPEADILLLSGDICIARYLAPERTDQDAKKHKKVAREFFEKAAAKYKHIVYIFGNHEHYHGDVTESKNIIKTFLADLSNIHILENEIFEIEDVVILGCTLWTDFNKNDPLSLITACNEMNDFRIISINQKKVFLPADSYKLHQESRIFLNETIKKYHDRKIIVMTHHAPSKLSTHPRHKEDYYINGAYSSNLTDLMSPHVKYWFHGHTHDSFDYMIYDTRVICNPKGYYKRQENPKFNPSLIVET